MPRSNSQTSPLRGGILFLIQEREQGAACLSDLLVWKRTGVERQLSRTPQHLNREGLSIGGWQGLKGFEEFSRVPAHTFKLSRFLPAGKPPPRRGKFVPDSRRDACPGSTFGIGGNGARGLKSTFSTGTMRGRPRTRQRSTFFAAAHRDRKHANITLTPAGATKRIRGPWHESKKPVTGFEIPQALRQRASSAFERLP
jgi:hypothetical protein